MEEDEDEIEIIETKQIVPGIIWNFVYAYLYWVVFVKARSETTQWSWPQYSSLFPVIGICFNHEFPFLTQ